MTSGCRILELEPRRHPPAIVITTGDKEADTAGELAEVDEEKEPRRKKDAKREPRSKKETKTVEAKEKAKLPEKVLDGKDLAGLPGKVAEVKEKPVAEVKEKAAIRKKEKTVKKAIVQRKNLEKAANSPVMEPRKSLLFPKLDSAGSPRDVVGLPSVGEELAGEQTGHHQDNSEQSSDARKSKVRDFR